jgi:hypothetical protein
LPPFHQILNDHSGPIRDALSMELSSVVGQICPFPNRSKMEDTAEICFNADGAVIPIGQICPRTIRYEMIVEDPSELLYPWRRVLL